MNRTSVPKKAGPNHQRSNSQRGIPNQNSFTEDHSGYEQENFELASKGFKNSYIVGKSDNTRGGFVPKGAAAAKFNEKKKNHHRRKEVDDENELSSLSGFTASDNEEHEDDIKFKMNPRSQKKNVRQLSDSDEENLEEEHRDIMLNPKDDLKARFAQLEMIKKKNEEEKRQREILGERDLNEEEEEDSTPVPLKRPQSSYGRGGSENMNTRGYMSKQQKENMLPSRPQTANVSNMRIQQEEEQEERPSVPFKPIYTKSINQTLMEKKVFNYADKKFKTLPKKSDPVSRFNAFRNGWNKTKFLKNTGGNDNKKEGRKLNLSVRNQTSKPDFVFHKYQPKYVFDV